MPYDDTHGVHPDLTGYKQPMRDEGQEIQHGTPPADTRATTAPTLLEGIGSAIGGVVDAMNNPNPTGKTWHHDGSSPLDFLSPAKHRSPWGGAHDVLTGHGHDD